jgi:hypothetical protein
MILQHFIKRSTYWEFTVWLSVRKVAFESISIIAISDAYNLVSTAPIVASLLLAVIIMHVPNEIFAVLN